MSKLVMAALKQHWIATTAYCLSGAAIIWMYVAIYPSLAAQAASYNQLMASLPQSVLKAFGAGGLTGNNFEALIGIKQYGLVWPLMLFFMVISQIGSSITGEIEKGTIGLWLSAPVSRLQTYWSKYIAVMLALLVFILFSVVAVIPIANLSNVAVTNSNIWALTLIGGLTGLAVLGFTSLVASMMSEKSHTYMIVSVVLLGMYIMNIVAELYPTLGWLRYGSVFYYYNINAILTSGPISHVSIAVLGSVAIFGSLLGAFIFKKRDITI